MGKISVLLAIVLSTTVHAQVKEGYLKFTMEIIGGQGAYDMSSLLGNASMAIYFKNDKSLTNMTSPIYVMKTLTDSKGTLTLVEGIGQKSFTRKQMKKPLKTNPKAMTHR